RSLEFRVGVGVDLAPQVDFFKHRRCPLHGSVLQENGTKFWQGSYSESQGGIPELLLRLPQFSRNQAWRGIQRAPWPSTIRPHKPSKIPSSDLRIRDSHGGALCEC